MKLQYSGPDRRRHRLLVTRNTEYHFRGEVCVGVRDRRSGRWLAAHLALNRRLSGSVRFFDNGAVIPVDEPPSVGEALYFAGEGRELVTSLLCEITRPDKSSVDQYSCHAAN